MIADQAFCILKTVTSRLDTLTTFLWFLPWSARKLWQCANHGYCCYIKPENGTARTTLYLLISTKNSEQRRRNSSLVDYDSRVADHKLMGKKKVQSSSGIWSAVASWFVCFGSANKAADSGRPGSAGYDPAAGMVAAAKHFSSAHNVKFG